MSFRRRASRPITNFDKCKVITKKSEQVENEPRPPKIRRISSNALAQGHSIGKFKIRSVHGKLFVLILTYFSN